MIQATHESALQRVLAPVTDCLTPEVARRIIDARLDPAVQRRLNKLAPKANLGTLTDTERSEYAALIDGVDILAIFKAKARLLLSEQDSR
jgi:hypothetical protein